MRCQKYYKNLFYGLLDMAIVNAFIVHRMYAKSIDERPMSHADFLIQLHEEMIRLVGSDFTDQIESEPEQVVPAVARILHSNAFSMAKTTHTVSKSMDQSAGGNYKFRVCKVCSILKGKKADGRAGVALTTRYFCDQCSDDRGKVYLCNDVRRVDEGNTVSCFNIWHSMWKHGRQLPVTASSGTIRIRRSDEQRGGISTNLFSPGMESRTSTDYGGHVENSAIEYSFSV
jgi:hypothetical protein